ncbi:hypothetical protein [Paraflavitalea sp. CAU 1676]|uniref:hypothetical protein n=1 Tax=Paraflavitalea sp. CAU 1676 TaxID=3032598 RepID=UPI0023D98820|nr:hypothetical protein [Paraflavitalea sp. CAU 1676]MDF2188944.1 hypothetical protein [Paraflavitalea sp. CAU 1676]
MASKNTAAAARQTAKPVLSVVNFENVDFSNSQNAPAVTSQAEVLPPAPAAIVLQDDQNVMQSKRYVRGIVEYMSPAEILEPVLQLLRQTSGKLILTGTNELTNANADSSLNVSYGRLNLVARFEIDAEVFYEIGVLIAYDLQIPKIKIYSGAKVSACMNLCVFQADDVVKFDITNGVNLQMVQTFLTQLTERIANVSRIVQRLKGVPISPEAMDTLIGRMLIKTTEKKLAHGTTSILSGLDTMTDDRSKYYYKQPNFNAWLFYNAFTEYMEKRVNFFDIPDKARDVFSLISENCLS